MSVLTASLLHSGLSLGFFFFFRGLEGFLLSEGSDGLMNVHCFTQPRTVVCAEDIGLFFGWAHRGYVFNNVLQITD